MAVSVDIDLGYEFTVKAGYDEVFDLLPAVDLLCFQIALQVVQLVRIGLPLLDRGAVVLLERRLHGLRVVGEVEHECVRLLRVRSVQS